MDQGLKCIYEQREGVLYMLFMWNEGWCFAPPYMTTIQFTLYLPFLEILKYIFCQSNESSTSRYCSDLSNREKHLSFNDLLCYK